MIYPEADKLESWGSKYALVTLAARRAKQIKSGAPPLVDTPSRNPLTIALEEIAAGKITCDVPDYDEVIVSAVEPEVADLLAIPIESDEEEEAAESLTTEEETVTSDEDEEYLEEEEEEEEEEPDVWKAALEDEESEEVVVEEPVADLDADHVEAPPVPELTEEEPKPKRGRRKKIVDEEEVVPLDEVEPEAVFAEDEESEEE